MTKPDVPVVTPPAEFTAETLSEFEDACAPYMGALGIVVDLDGVRMISSAGLSRMVRLGKTLDEGGASLALARGRRKIVKLIYTVGLDAVMPHFGTLEEAHAYLLGRE